MKRAESTAGFDDDNLAQTRRATPFPDWLPLSCLVVVVAGLAYWASSPVDDPDTWWHLRLGEEFRGAWSLADPGALTPFATESWFATQWTLELLASYVEEAGGLSGVSWLAGVGVVLLAIAVYISCRQRGKVASASVATSLCLLGASLSFGPRPQIASFIFAAVVTAAWLRTIDDLKPRWWLIAISWLWACTHGMWFVGVIIGVLVVVGLLMDRRLSCSTAVRLGLIPVLSLMAGALTPVGPKLVLAPFATKRMAEFVAEWQPPNFTEFVPVLALLSIATVVVTWARGPRNAWSEILLLSLAAGWVLLSYRTIALGVTIAAPLVSGSIQSWLPPDRLLVPRWEPLVGVTAAAMIALGLAVSSPTRGEAPLEGLDRISATLGALPQGTTVYNEYTLGGWLEWRHRNVVPVVDGMTDAYEVDHVAAYAAAGRLEPGWREFIGATGAQYALLMSDSRLAAALVERHEWRDLVQESGYVLLGRT